MSELCTRNINNPHVNRCNLIVFAERSEWNAWYLRETSAFRISDNLGTGSRAGAAGSILSQMPCGSIGAHPAFEHRPLVALPCWVSKVVSPCVYTHTHTRVYMYIYIYMYSLYSFMQHQMIDDPILFNRLQLQTFSILFLCHNFKQILLRSQLATCHGLLQTWPGCVESITSGDRLNMTQSTKMERGFVFFWDRNVF